MLSEVQRVVNIQRLETLTEKHGAKKKRRIIPNYQQRKKGAEVRKQRDEAISDDATAVWEAMEEAIQTISLQHNRSVDWIRDLIIHRGPFSKSKRSGNIWNAVNHCKALLQNESEFHPFF
jgi:hypothetical protein